MALEFSAQVARVERRVDDARPWGRLGEFPRQEDVADLGLPVVVLHPLVLGAAIVVEDHAVRLGAGNVHGDGGGPYDADAGRRRRGCGPREEREEQLVEQVRTQAVGAYL